MRTRFIRPALVAAAAALVVAVPTALAGAIEEVTPLSPAPSGGGSADAAEWTNLWFVELQSPPAVKGTSAAKLSAEKKAFRDAAKDADVAYTERYAYGRLWNGLSVKVADPSQVSALSRLPGVKAVYPVLTATPPPAATVSPELATAIAMTGADSAYEAGYTGAGVRVAVMDSGVDYDHSALGGDGISRDNSDQFPNSRVVAGWDFVGDGFNATSTSPDYNPVPVPDQFPDDCGAGSTAGHGTHVAGIVGASGAVTGVAPEAQIGSYRVFGCSGATTVDIMLAAMERALADGMDVLNMSIGSAFVTWPQYPTAAASDNLVDAGVVVVASIGNSGGSGLYSASAPGVGNKVIGVASFDNSHAAGPGFTISPDNAPVPYIKAVGLGSVPPPPDPPTSGSLPMKETPAADAVGAVPADGTGLPVADACDPLPAGHFAGHAALIRRGTCPFSQKAMNAEAAGASAVILYNNAAGSLTPQLGTSPQVEIPVVMISRADGHLIHNRLVADPVTMTWQESVSAVNPTGGLISAFSSYGLTADLQLKPDIGAPGGLIRSTYPLQAGGFATISGTSMSSPHVAGAVALYLQAKPGSSPARVRDALLNSADPAVWWGSAAFVENVHAQGAGMLDIDDSIAATTLVRPAKLSVGEGTAATTHTLTIQNSSSAAVTYTPSHQPALGTHGSTFVPGFNDAYATVTFGSPSVTVPAGGTGTLDVTITPFPGVAAFKVVYGGYVALEGDDGTEVRVPYAGFNGDYQGFPVMTSGGATPPFPKLARHTGFVSASNLTPTYVFPTDPVTYTLETTMVNGRPVVDAPTVAVHLDHQVRWLRMTLLDAAGVPAGGPNSVVLFAEYWPRNATSTGTNATTDFFAFAWDGAFTKTAGKSGKVVTAPQPDGQYRLRVEILKALGTEGTAGHTETYTSPVFTLDRP